MRGHVAWLWRTAFGLWALLLISGCERGIDTEQARLCRIAIAGLETGSRIEIIGQHSRSGGGVRLLYRLRNPGKASIERVAECTFAPGAPDTARPRDLAGVVFDGRRLGDVRRQLLVRHWLERPESVAADPEPIAGANMAAEVDAGLARALQTLIASLPLISVYALLAAAYSLIYGLIGRINLAFGEIAVGGAIAAYLGMAAAGQVWPWLLVVAAATLAMWTGIVHGIVSARAVLAPLSRRTGQIVLVGTLGLSLAVQEYFRLAQGARVQWMPPLLETPHAVARSGDYIVTLTPQAIVVTGLASLAGVVVIAAMRLSRYGRWWRACADDPLAAGLLGVDPVATLVATTACASALAGLAGALMTLHYGGAGHAGGLALGLKALIAAILGGIGSVPGAFVGGIAIGAAEAAWSAFLPIEHRDMFIFLLLAVVLAVRPDTGNILSIRHREPT